MRGNSSTQTGQWPLTKPPKKIFGLAISSRIGGIAHNYLRSIPGLANDQDAMAETTEIYDTWLKLEMLDHYQRMTKKKRMSSVSMQQWLTGAALHLHMRIHQVSQHFGKMYFLPCYFCFFLHFALANIFLEQVRLHSVPIGSVESLRLSYKTAFNRLVQGYTIYLHRNIWESAASAPQRRSNGTCSSQAETFNETSHGGAGKTDEVASTEGLLVIETGRNVSHNVLHHPCESPAIQRALATRIINAQDLEHSRSFFLHSKKVLQQLFAQEEAFELSPV